MSRRYNTTNEAKPLEILVTHLLKYLGKHMSVFLRLQSNWSAATITNFPTVPLLVNLGVKSHLSRCGVHDCNMFSVEERPMSP